MTAPTRLSFSRYEFPELIDRAGFKTAVEVGVNLGQFSYHLLKYSKLSLLLAVDSYRGKYKKAMRGAQSLLEPYVADGRCYLMRMGSAEAAQTKSYCRFDFVYIDAAHDEASVAADLAAWAPLVRPGGILAGHDYCDAHKGVIQAVNKFASNTGWEMQLTREAWASWVFRVPMTRATHSASGPAMCTGPAGSST